MRWARMPPLRENAFFLSSSKTRKREEESWLRGGGWRLPGKEGTS
jgi:hypothetical protein